MPESRQACLILACGEAPEACGSREPACPRGARECDTIEEEKLERLIVPIRCHLVARSDEVFLDLGGRLEPYAKLLQLCHQSGARLALLNGVPECHQLLKLVVDPIVVAAVFISTREP